LSGRRILLGFFKIRIKLEIKRSVGQALGSSGKGRIPVDATGSRPRIIGALAMQDAFLTAVAAWGVFSNPKIALGENIPSIAPATDPGTRIW